MYTKLSYIYHDVLLLFFLNSIGNNGISDPAGKLVEAECRELFHFVTVKQRQYYVYRYEGNLNGIEKAVVLLTYLKNAF